MWPSCHRASTNNPGIVKCPPILTLDRVLRVLKTLIMVSFIMADYDRYDFLHFQFKSGIVPFGTQRVLVR